MSRFSRYIIKMSLSVVVSGYGRIKPKQIEESGVITIIFIKFFKMKL